MERRGGVRDRARYIAKERDISIFSSYWSSRMSASTLSSAGLDIRRRQILFRAWHRGTREMDLLMGRFADAALPGLSDAEIDAFERLIERPDGDLFGWIMGEAEAPPDVDTPMFRRLKAFHRG
jgi:antitoxin CptB